MASLSLSSSWNPVKDFMSGYKFVDDLYNAQEDRSFLRETRDQKRFEWQEARDQARREADVREADRDVGQLVSLMSPNGTYDPNTALENPETLKAVNTLLKGSRFFKGAQLQAGANTPGNVARVPAQDGGDILVRNPHGGVTARLSHVDKASGQVVSTGPETDQAGTGPMENIVRRQPKDVLHEIFSGLAAVDPKYAKLYSELLQGQNIRDARGRVAGHIMGDTAPEQGFTQAPAAQVPTAQAPAAQAPAAQALAASGLQAAAAPLQNDRTGPGTSITLQSARAPLGVVIPQAYETSIEKWSGGDAAKASWLRNIMATEWRGRGEVVNSAEPGVGQSPKGALGGFQFIKSTAVNLKDPQGKPYTHADMLDTDKATHAASQLYDELYRRFKGNRAAMAAAYNGGTTAGKNVLDGKDPGNDETRAYVAAFNQAEQGQGGVAGDAPAPSTAAPTSSLAEAAPQSNAAIMEEGPSEYNPSLGALFAASSDRRKGVIDSAVSGPALSESERPSLPGRIGRRQAQIQKRNVERQLQLEAEAKEKQREAEVQRTVRAGEPTVSPKAEVQKPASAFKPEYKPVPVAQDSPRTEKEAGRGVTRMAAQARTKLDDKTKDAFKTLVKNGDIKLSELREMLGGKVSKIAVVNDTALVFGPGGQLINSVSVGPKGSTPKQLADELKARNTRIDKIVETVLTPWRIGQKDGMSPSEGAAAQSLVYNMFAIYSLNPNDPAVPAFVSKTLDTAIRLVRSDSKWYNPFQKNLELGDLTNPGSVVAAVGLRPDDPNAGYEELKTIGRAVEVFNEKHGRSDINPSVITGVVVQAIRNGVPPEKATGLVLDLLNTQPYFYKDLNRNRPIHQVGKQVALYYQSLYRPETQMISAGARG